MDIEQLLRPNIKSFKAYSSAREIHSGMTGIFLDANENSLEPVYGVGLNRYPDPLQHHLKQKISDIKKVDADRIFLGNGSDEPIDLLIRAFCEPGKDEILICPPTYGMYEVSADLNDVKIKRIDLTADFMLQMDKILSSLEVNTKLIFLCSPNNPTANLLKKADIEYLIGKTRGIVVIDEAYIDFAEEPGWLPELEQYENLVILQTFSKAWGLAYIRVGMAFADECIVEVLNRIKYPYNINGLSQDIVLKALDHHHKKDYLVNVILEERERLIAELAQLKMVETIFPTQANFILLRVRNAQNVYKRLLDNYILIRDRSNHPLTRDCIRITVGSPEENTTLLNHLREMDLQ